MCERMIKGSLSTVTTDGEGNMFIEKSDGVKRKLEQTQVTWVLPEDSLNEEVSTIVDMLCEERGASAIPWVIEAELKVCSGHSLKSGVSEYEYQMASGVLHNSPYWKASESHVIDLSYPDVRVSYDGETKKYIGSMLKQRFGSNTWNSDYIGTNLKLSMSGEYAIVASGDLDTSALCQEDGREQLIGGEPPQCRREKIRTTFTHISEEVPWRMDITEVCEGGFEIEVEFLPSVWTLDKKDLPFYVKSMLQWLKVVLSGNPQSLTRELELPHVVDYANPDEPTEEIEDK